MHSAKATAQAARQTRNEVFFGDRPPSGDLRSAAIGGSRWSALQQFGSRVATTVVFVALARLLSPEAFGVVALATVFVALLQILVEGGFGQAIIQRSNLLPGHADTVFWVSLATASVLTTMLLLSAGALADLFDEPQLAPVLRVLSAALVIGALGSAQAALLRRNLRFRPLAVRAVVSDVVGGFAGVGAALLGLGVWALVVQYLTVSVLHTALLWATSGWRPGLDVSRVHFNDVFKFSRNSLGNSMLGFANQRSVDLFISSWLGSATLGIYTVAYRLSALVNDVINQMLLSVALPVFSRLQNEAARLRHAYLSVLGVGAALSYPGYLFLVAGAPDITMVMFGERWLGAVDVMRILAVFGALQTTVAITDACLVASGRPHVSFRNRLANTVVQVAAFAVAAPFGLRWVAASMVARAAIMHPLPLWALRRAGIVQFSQYFRALYAPLSAALVMLVVVFGVLSRIEDALTPIGRLSISLGIGAVVYTSILWLLDRSLVREVLQLVRRGPATPLRPHESPAREIEIKEVDA